MILSRNGSCLALNASFRAGLHGLARSCIHFCAPKWPLLFLYIALYDRTRNTTPVFPLHSSLFFVCLVLQAGVDYAKLPSSNFITYIPSEISSELGSIPHQSRSWESSWAGSSARDPSGIFNHNLNEACAGFGSLKNLATFRRKGLMAIEGSTRRVVGSLRARSGGEPVCKGDGEVGNGLLMLVEVLE